VTWLIGLYPPAWRRRYGRELAELLAAQPMSFRTAVDLVAGAVDAWLKPQSSTAVTTTDAKGARAMLPEMLQLTSGGYGTDVTVADSLKAAAVTIGGMKIVSRLSTFGSASENARAKVLAFMGVPTGTSGTAPA